MHSKPNRPTNSSFVFVPLTFFAAIVIAASVSAQNPNPIWAGAYTTQQAERGRAVVQNHCIECHAEDLSGAEAPALVGPSFMVKWETHEVGRLFAKIRDTMPSRGDTSVSEAEKLDAVAYILQQNGFPAGKSELRNVPEELAALRMVPRDGVAAPRPGALVQAVGCLREPGPNRWEIAESTEPRVTTLDPMSESDKAAAASGPAGSQTIELISVYPRPTAFVNQRVLVKGLFIKTASDTRINVTQLEPLGSDCGK